MITYQIFTEASDSWLHADSFGGNHLLFNCFLLDAVKHLKMQNKKREKYDLNDPLLNVYIFENKNKYSW